MRAFLWLLVIAGVTLAQDTDVTLAALQAKIDALTARLTDFETAGIHFYKDRASCPAGFYPMENAEGRFLLLAGSDRGQLSGHTFKDEKILSLPCSNRIEVAETGFANVCSSSASGTTIKVDLEALVPYYKVLGCIKSGGPQPVV
jgi:hypothetical protein